MTETILKALKIPGEAALEKARPGAPAALTGMNGALAAATACLLARKGKRVLLACDSDLKAARMADDVRQLIGERGTLLPGGEIDLTRAAGSQESSWRRLEALAAVTDGRAAVLCTSAEALSQRMGRPEPWRALTTELKTGDAFPPEDLCRRLLRMGYERVAMVEGKGQFARRGAIVDVYPPALSQGIRMEFFDDEVDSIRAFDCISQRSQEDLGAVTLTPASEALLPEEAWAEAARRMREALGAAGPVQEETRLFEELPPLPPDEDDDAALFDAAVAPKVREKAYREAQAAEIGRRTERLLADADSLEEGIPFRRARAWITVLTGKTGRVTDWFRPDIVLLAEPARLRERIEERLQGFGEDLSSAMGRGEAVREQEGLLADWETVRQELEVWPLGLITDIPLGMGGIRPAEVTAAEARGVQGYNGQLRQLKTDLEAWRQKEYRIFLLSGGVTRGKRLADSLAELGEKAVFLEKGERETALGETVILPMTLSRGFVLEAEKTAVVSDADLWGEGYRKAKSRKHSGERISTFTDLKVGDYVVHEDHGVGIYQGTARIQSEGTWRDYLLIRYNGNDKLYVPVEQLERVQRYIGNPNQPPKLNDLGGREWARQKGKVKESLRTLAFDLKNLYAERSRHNGYAFGKETAWQREFEDEFPYELTPDQAQSVREIEADMESDRNMDRLLCGDVGYGKTEVSLRAAFKAIVDNKQVALLAPTTILVQQHYNTVVKRFRHTGARVEYLSRFRTAKEQREVLTRLAAGDVDIIIGTHRLLGKDVKFRDLGLLIVDEEQRFGVAHKEIIKEMKRQVDVLTLSATPIPRTLHMSMVGIRDMSVLETPPEERIPVQTLVTEYSDALIRDAILRELGRGGQVYFLYNRVRSIEQFYNRLRALVPEARIGIAHGQMREHALEDAMMDFYAGSYDVLLCTTIIENGLDVPNANTLIVFDAERFGLSQLYQLRGRVGRSNRQAYAYFTVRTDHALSETAQQRLAAIREFTEFGAGFRIAMRDMEIRGAGNILGPEQHGHLATVGYDMYCKLMEEALSEAQGHPARRELETRIDLRVDAYLPSDYVADEQQRMEMYKRIASVSSDGERADITDELIDRFGDLPPAAETLLDVSQLRELCNRVGISQVIRNRDGLYMRLDERYVPDPARFLQAISETDGRLTLSARKPAALLLRDPQLREQEALGMALKTMKKLTARLEALQTEAPDEA